jgi:hypothetical protein
MPILVNYAAAGSSTISATSNMSTASTGSFGYNGAGTYSSASFYSDDIFICIPGYTGVTSTGVSMSFLTSNSDAANAHNIQCAIYTLSGGTFNLVAKTASISVPALAAKGWVTGNFTTSPNLSSSTTYYLAVSADSSSLKFYVDSQSGWGQYVYGSQFGTWPSTFTSPTLNWNVKMPILVNYATSQ